MVNYSFDCGSLAPCILGWLLLVLFIFPPYFFNSFPHSILFPLSLSDSTKPYSASLTGEITGEESNETPAS